MGGQGISRPVLTVTDVQARVADKVKREQVISCLVFIPTMVRVCDPCPGDHAVTVDQEMVEAVNMSMEG